MNECSSPLIDWDDPIIDSVLREQWILAKYARLEFQDQDKQTYLSGSKEGYLWKQGKEDKKFQKRRFLLSEAEGTLKYFNREVSTVYSFGTEGGVRATRGHTVVQVFS